MPEITVLMPVRNGEKYINEAIDSILKQTFTDFELLIIDDGSTDRTIERIQEYRDVRIRLETRKHDFIQNLNLGLKLASGSYIARMDADDIMHTERLRVQLKRMKKNPNISVCGTWAKVFSDNRKEQNFSHQGSGIIYDPVLQLLKHNMLIHPSVMMKKSFLFDNHIEYQDYPCVEDYKMWFDIAKAGGELFIEPQELLMFRRSDMQVTAIKTEEMRMESIRLRKEILCYLLSIHSNKTLDHLFLNFEDMESKGWMLSEDTFRFFVNLLENKKRVEKLF